MARLDERLEEAHAALATLKELVDRDNLSLGERDGAILRLVYTFEVIWKAAALFLEQEEGIAVGSPKAAIRASRQAGLLSDDDTEHALLIADDRNLTVHMYKQDIGDEIAQRLPAHAELMSRWLNSMNKNPPGRSETYRLFERAMTERKQILCTYDGYDRALCPIILGHSSGEETALTFQFGGESKSGLPPSGDWKCLRLAAVRDVQLRDGAWQAGARHSQEQTCVEIVDLDVNPDSPYSPKRRLQPGPSLAKRSTGRGTKRGGAASHARRGKSGATTTRRK
jgi:hypothetical protein